MKNETYCLVLTIILTSVLWIPYILNRLYEHKLQVLRNPNRLGFRIYEPCLLSSLRLHSFI